jgi:hypothetical protein
MIGGTGVIHTMHQGFRANDEEATILGKLEIVWGIPGSE